MKKAIAILALAFAGMTALAQTSVWNGGRQMWTRGEGTENDPFLIESAENLAYMAYVVNKGFQSEGVYFRLTTDIDLNGSEDQQWIPIGIADRWFNDDGCDRGIPNYFTPATYFCGHFDGGEHSISNLYIDNRDGKYGRYTGLFGFVRGQQIDEEVYPAVVENVFVTSGYLNGASICGGIVGRAENVVVSRCWNGARIEGDANGGLQSGIGGIVGMSGNSLQVRNCYNVGPVSGYMAAGILGNGNVEIENCYNEGDISGTFAGGIFGGIMRGSVNISNCYNTGSISADGVVMSSAPAGPAAGGIVGAFLTGNTYLLSNCYNVGTISSTKDEGCILGYGPLGTTLENCFYIETCEAGGEGDPLTDEYMRSQAFVDFLNSLDMGQEWVLDDDNTNGGFPVLAGIDLAIGEATEVLFSVYPNPAQGQFTVEGTGVVRITNMMGQMVGIHEIDGQQIFALPKGMYIVTLNGQTAKVVVE